MKQFAGWRQWPTRSSVRGLISLSMLALLLVSSILLQGASSGLAATSHRPVVSQQGQAHHKAKPALGGSPRWKYQTGSSVQSSPALAIVNGVPTVYVGSDDHSVYALTATNGSKLWSYQTGDRVVDKPAVVNSVVYVGSLDHSIYALNATNGTVLWSYQTAGQIWSSSAVVSGVVYVGSYDNSNPNSGYVYALNATNGTVLWSYQTAGEVYSSPTVVNGVVYVGTLSPDDSVYAFDATNGTVLWHHQLGAAVYSPAVVNGVVYVGTNNGYVYALDANNQGALLWSYQTESAVLSTPAVAVVTINGVPTSLVYVGSEDNSVYALNATNGTVLWSYQTAGFVDSSPAVVNGVVYVGSFDHSVYALNATNGTVLWRYQMGNSVYSSPAVVNGVVYVGSFDSYVYALTTAAPQLAVVGNQLVDKNTGQPMQLHGVNRDGTQYACIDANPHGKSHIYKPFPDVNGPTPVEIANMQTEWGMNAVRIPLNEQCWLGTPELPPGAVGGVKYQTYIAAYVLLLNQAGLVAILDLDYSAPAGELASGNNSMPDASYSLQFWQSVAQTFAGNDAVVFDAFNEPAPPIGTNNSYDATTWTCWLKGQTYSGDPTNSCGGGCPDFVALINGLNTVFQCVGMQQVVQAIRTYASDNVIMLGGVAAASEFNLWNQYLPQDPNTGQAYTNLALSAHFIDSNAFDQGSLIQQIQNGYPVIAGVVKGGSIPNQNGYTNDDFLFPTLKFLDDPGGGHTLPAQSYLGWSWNVNLDDPSVDLVTDFVPGHPSICYGQAYQAYLLGLPPPTCP